MVSRLQNRNITVERHGEQSCLVHSAQETEQGNSAKKKGAKNRPYSPRLHLHDPTDTPRSVLHQSPGQISKPIKLTLCPICHIGIKKYNGFLYIAFVSYNLEKLLHLLGLIWLCILCWMCYICDHVICEYLFLTVCF